MTNTDPPTDNRAEHSADNQSDDAMRERLLQQLASKIEPIMSAVCGDWHYISGRQGNYASAKSPEFKLDLDAHPYQWGWARDEECGGELHLWYIGDLHGEPLPSLMRSGERLLGTRTFRNTWRDGEEYYLFVIPLDISNPEGSISLPDAKVLAAELTERWLLEIYAHC